MTDILLAVCAALLIIVIVLQFRKNDGKVMEELRRLKDDSADNAERVGKLLQERVDSEAKHRDKRITDFTASVDKQLSEMRKTMDSNMRQVHENLGEMKQLAAGVNDLKKVLSNVKTRGILGEIQLGTILEEILAPEQYETDIATVPNSANRVEFAVKLPGSGEGTVYLPMDSKFPLDVYSRLLDAYDTGDKALIAARQKELETSLRNNAKDIHDKYIAPPHTTDFGVMFLPVEGLYAEALRLGMAEKLQQSFKINIAGPTTTAALLNSLQTGFRTLAIQKKSAEVWSVLESVREEFETFGTALEGAKKKIDAAGSEMEKLMTTRSNVMRRKLKDIAKYSDDTPSLDK
ncbi:MAG: DNA recombination protein RmuC [Abditibacteriota bacterium]|nr:DNA recombination protein RmuC [Abditibacteriota bacterium]